MPPPTAQPVALAVAFRLVRLPPLKINPGLLASPRVRARVRLPLKTSVAEPDILSTSPSDVYVVFTSCVLKVPPPTAQLVALAMAFKLVSLPPLRINPGLLESPRVRLRIRLPLKTSVAEP